MSDNPYMVTRRRAVHLIVQAAAWPLAARQQPSAVVVLIGAPGSGKSTIAGMLAKQFGHVVIDAAKVAADNRATLEKRRTRGIQNMDLIEDPGMNELMRREIENSNLSQGIILDGYPATKFQADFLTELRKTGRIPAVTVLQLDVPDEVIRKRIGASMTQEQIEQRIKDYRRELENASLYYPEARVIKIDANRPPEETFRAVLAAMGVSK